MVHIDGAQLLDEAHRLGFEVCRDGDRLHIEGPQDAEWFVAKLAEASRIFSPRSIGRTALSFSPSPAPASPTPPARSTGNASSSR